MEVTSSVADTKKCPLCAETIKAEAVIRRFCNRDLKAIIEQPKQTSSVT